MQACGLSKPLFSWLFLTLFSTSLAAGEGSCGAKAREALWRQAREQRARGAFAPAYGKLNVAVTNCGPDLAPGDRADFYLELSELALAQRSRRMCRDNLQAAKSQLKGAARTPEREKRASELERECGKE